MIKQILLFLLVISSLGAIAQTDTFSISGRVVDEETGEGVPFANVVLFQDGKQKNEVSADIDGNFMLSNLLNDEYLLKCQFVGYTLFEVESIYPNLGKSLSIEMAIDTNFVFSESLNIRCHFPPLLSKNQIDSMLTTGMNKIYISNIEPVCNFLRLPAPILEYPLVSPFGSGSTWTKEEIMRMPYR